MKIHKNTRLTPIQRKQLRNEYYQKSLRICDLCKQYQISRPTVYKILERSRNNDYSIHNSTNKRFRCLEYGLKRLSKIEKELEEKQKKQAKRYNKNYPGEMFHFDTKRLPILKGESPHLNHEYLFVAIDDFSRELYAGILPDKTQHSSSDFLNQVLIECPYTIEQAYSDNGTEYRGNPKQHAFAKLCANNKIEQRFTKVRRPRTNGKAERVIRTLIEMWHSKTRFKNRNQRKLELIRFVNYYNTVKPHKGINGQTPFEKLINYFYPIEL
jgi:transposase InsO family protein